MTQCHFPIEEFHLANSLSLSLYFHPGDSGGPLTLNGVLVGVVSWGSSQCRHDVYPNVYANVATLRTWILNNQS